MNWFRQVWSYLDNEDGVFPWLALGLGLLGFAGQQSAAGAQARAAGQTQEQIDLQKELQDYMLGKRKTLYDPIERDVLLPKLTARATSEPAWAPQAGFWARQLGSKMSFPTS